MMAQLLTVGEMLVEFMACETGPGFLEPMRFTGPYASGAPAIMIRQAARFGASCAISACVRQDDFGEMSIRRLRECGADVSGILIKKEETTGTAFVRYQKDGRRHFIYHFSKAAAGSLTEDEVDSRLFSDVRIFHIMGCSMSTSGSLRRAVLRGAELAHQNGALLSFDPNIRQELLADHEVQSALRWALDSCDILLTSPSELEAIMGQDVETALNDLKKQNKQAVIVKDGSRGVRVIADGEDVFLKAYRVSEVDPTGAGDCFDGAFLALFLSGKPCKEAARFANAAAALSVTKKGPMEGIVNLSTVLNFLGR